MTTALAPRTGLIGTPLNELLTPDLTLDDVAYLVARVEAGIDDGPWVLGEILIYGENKFGEDISSIYPDPTEDPKGHRGARMRQTMWMVRTFPPDTRVPELTYTHHRVVADLDPKDRAEMLKAAVREAWSTRDLDREVKQLAEDRRSIPAVVTEAVCAADMPWAPSKDDLLPEHRAALEAAALDADLDDPTGFAAGALWMARYTASEALFAEGRWRDG